MTRPGSTSPVCDSPTVVHRWLYNALRQLRSDIPGLTQAQVAQKLKWSKGKIGHLETGHVLPRREDLLVLLPIYGITTPQLDWYLELADKAREHGWWDAAPGVPSWFGLYVGLEWGAERLLSYDLGFVPGLLQARRYAEAIIRDGTDNEDDIKDQVGQRLRRQDALHRTRPLQLHAIIDEAALRRRVGSSAVMREQLVHLIALASRASITLQVMPFGAGQHRGQLGSFSWLSFATDPSRADPGVAYIESQTGGIYFDELDQIARYRTTFDSLSARALNPAQSIDFIHTVEQDFPA